MKSVLLLLALVGVSACAQVPVPTAYSPIPAAPALVKQQSVEGIRAEMVVMAKRQFTRQDKNKDGAVDRFKEWEGWDNDFILADKDRNNKVTLAEYTELMTGQLSVDTFQSIAYRVLREADRDQDGTVSGAEWQQFPHQFSDGVKLAKQDWRAFDADTNGRLSDSEFEDAFAHYWARHD